MCCHVSKIPFYGWIKRDVSILLLVDVFIHWWTPALLPPLLWITPLWTWVCKYLCQSLLWLGLDRDGQAIPGRLKHCRPAPYFRVFFTAFPCSESSSLPSLPTVWWVLLSGQQLCWTPPGFPFRVGRAWPSTFGGSVERFLTSMDFPASSAEDMDMWLKLTYESTSPKISMTFKIGKNLIGGYGNLSPRVGF